MLGRPESALQMYRDVYSGHLKLHGEEHFDTLQAANNYGSIHIDLNLFEELKSLMLKIVPVARRTLGEQHELTLKLRWEYAIALYYADGATFDNRREAVTTLEDTERIARRVLGGAHPMTVEIEENLQDARAALRARETPPAGDTTEGDS